MGYDPVLSETSSRLSTSKWYCRMMYIIIELTRLTQPFSDPRSDHSRRYGRGADREPEKGCVYCNQRGCVQESFSPKDHLPDMMEKIGRWSSAEKVRVSNLDRTVKVLQGGEGEISKEVMRKMTMECFREGEERSAECRFSDQGTGGEGQKGNRARIRTESRSRSPSTPRRSTSPIQACHRRSTIASKDYWDLLCHPSK